MPLFLDDEQISAKDLARRLGIKDEVFERVAKKPSFKLDDSQNIKKKTLKSPDLPMYGIKASVWIKEKDGISRRLTWAKSRSPKIEAGVRTWVYSPGYINLKGGKVAFPKEEDKALYMYLRPGNPSSPFAGARKMFTFIDTVAETLRMSSDMSDIQKALSHATNVEEEELIIIAKGLKILTSDDYDITELRLRMQQFAINPTTNKKYISGMDDEIVRIEGRIANLVDKGVIKLEKRGSTARQWVWATGSREGENIGDLIVNVNDDARQRLMTYIKSDLNSYLYDLRNSTVVIQADRKAREVLQSEKSVVSDVPVHLTEVNKVSNEGSLKAEVHDFHSAREFLGRKGFKKGSSQAKTLTQAIDEGHVNSSNVDAFLTNLFAKE